MPFPHFEIADFPHLDITESSVRRTLMIGLGLVQVVLGLIGIVRGFQQLNQAVVCGSLRTLRDGALAILAVVQERETCWGDVIGQVVDIVLSLGFIFAVVL